jgi:hypothetical protein
MTRTLIALALLALAPTRAWAAHTLGEPSPFHLAPGDHFTLPVTGGTFAGVPGLVVRFTPVGGGAHTDQAPESVVANTSAGVRVPSGLAVGQYDLTLLISGTPSDPPARRVWVRTRSFRFVGKSRTYLPGQPCASGSGSGCTFSDPDYKDANFGDVNNDGFLDVFSANSQNGENIDRLHVNQRGRAPGAADCPTEFCDRTAAQFENTVGGVPPDRRTYDADMADLDLDGDVDLVRVDQASDAPLRLFLNDGSGRFVDRSITRGGIGAALLPAFADIFGAMGGGQIATVDEGDADGDGRPDLLLCNWGGAGARTVLLLNRLATSGRFEIANTPCGGPGADGFCQADGPTNRGCGFGRFNNDARLDIVLAGLDATADDVVLLNTGNNGSGVPQWSVDANWIRGPAPGFGAPTPASAGNVAVADLDGDGDDDVGISSPWNTSPQGRILWNDQRTRLVELDPGRYPVPDGSYKVSFADLDRDGDIDLLYSPYSGGIGQTVLLNRGGRDANMKFDTLPGSALWFAESPGGSTVAAPGSYLNFSLSVHGGDYDLDGDEDLLTGGFDNVRVWRSDLFDQPGEDRDWVFALDRTRSMISGRDFFEPAKNVVRTFLGQRRAGDAVGLVAFDYTGASPGNPAAPDDANKAQVLANLGARTPAQLQSDVAGLGIGSCSGFCTAIGWAVKTAKDVALGGTDPVGREKVIVLATDGAQNQAPHPDTIIPGLPSQVRLYTVALGSDTDDRMLSALATNGGKFYFAGRSTDYESVQSSWRDVDEDIEAHATRKQRLHPLSGLAGFDLLRDALWRSPLIKALAQPRPAFLAAVGAVALAPQDYFVVDAADTQVRFTLSWRRDSRTNGLLLTDPKGRTYPAQGTDARVREQRGPRFHILEVLDPLSGVWSARSVVTGDSGPGKLTALASTALRLDAALPFPLHYVGEALTLRAELAEAGRAVAGVAAQARVIAPSKNVQVVAGTAAGPTTLQFAAGALTEPGTYRVQVIAVGPPQRPFVRTWESALHVATPTPDEVDLRKAELRLDRATLGVGESATATLRLVRRDGAPFDGASVSFVADGAELTGAVQARGGGRYSQSLTAGRKAGPGVVMARAGLFRLPERAAFEVRPAPVDPATSTFTLIVGIQKLCTNQRGRFALRVVPMDAHENALSGARVEIEKTSGPRLQWDGPVREAGPTGLYERTFWGPSRAGTFVFRATVNGVALARNVSLDVFPPDSPEGRALGCVAIAGQPPFDFGAWWWLWLLLLLLLVLLLVWLWLRRTTPVPALP